MSNSNDDDDYDDDDDDDDDDIDREFAELRCDSPAHQRHMPTSSSLCVE